MIHQLLFERLLSPFNGSVGYYEETGIGWVVYLRSSYRHCRSVAWDEEVKQYTIYANSGVLLVTKDLEQVCAELHTQFTGFSISSWERKAARWWDIGEIPELYSLLEEIRLLLTSTSHPLCREQLTEIQKLRRKFRDLLTDLEERAETKQQPGSSKDESAD